MVNYHKLFESFASCMERLGSYPRIIDKYIYKYIYVNNVYMYAHIYTHMYMPFVSWAGPLDLNHSPIHQVVAFSYNHKVDSVPKDVFGMMNSL